MAAPVRRVSMLMITQRIPRMCYVSCVEYDGSHRGDVCRLEWIYGQKRRRTLFVRSPTWFWDKYSISARTSQASTCEHCPVLVATFPIKLYSIELHVLSFLDQVLHNECYAIGIQHQRPMRKSHHNSLPPKPPAPQSYRYISCK